MQSKVNYIHHKSRKDRIMSFNGIIIKQKAKEAGINILTLAEKLKVSRQAINSWINGKVPRGHHLVELCFLLKIKPEIFFPVAEDQSIKVPVHRTIKKREVTPEMQTASLDMAYEYLNLFKCAPALSFVSVARTTTRNDENARLLAAHLRQLAGLGDQKVMGYEDSFRLLERLEIYVIFRSFPLLLSKKSYAFYTSISKQRVVFVNVDTNILDLIFQLLHETVHAIRDEELSAIDTFEEEEFCDKVAKYTQFPDFYVDMAEKIITGLSADLMVNRLKDLSVENGHSLFGLYYMLKDRNKKALTEDLNIGGAATNLAKHFPTCRDLLFKDSNPRYYTSMLYRLSPLFMKLVENNIESGVSIRKIGEWLGLDTTMDVTSVVEEIKLHSRTC